MGRKKKVAEQIPMDIDKIVEELGTVNVSGIETLDTDKAQAILKFLSVQRVTYFDDRYYKIDINMPTEEEDKTQSLKLLEHLPERLLSTDESGTLSIYLPSSTTILSHNNNPFLARWRGDVGNINADYISRKALTLGSEIHNVIDLRAKGYDVIYNDAKVPAMTPTQIAQYMNEVNPSTVIIDTQEVAVQLARFEQVFQALEPEILETETTVYNIAEVYAGTLDQVWNITEDKEIKAGRTTYKLPKGIYVVDIKTGSGINETQYFAQLSSYCKAENITSKYDVTGAIILHLNADIKSGIVGFKPYIKFSEELERYWNYFKNTRDNYIFENQVYPKFFEIPILFNQKLRKEM